MGKTSYVVFHELAHAYHDQILSFEDSRIIANFENAKRAGSYENVTLYRSQGKTLCSDKP